MCKIKLCGLLGKYLPGSRRCGRTEIGDKQLLPQTPGSSAIVGGRKARVIELTDLFASLEAFLRNQIS